MGTSQGAPEAACESMTPQHGVSPQTTDSPYNVKVSATFVKPGGTVDVTISGSKFKGFLLQAQDSADGKLVGSFASGVEGSKYLGCPGLDRATVTHTNPNEKETITFKWTAPSEATEKKVKMLATVVQERTMFWVKLSADEITVSSETVSSEPVSSESKTNKASSIAAASTAVAIFFFLINKKTMLINSSVMNK